MADAGDLCLILRTVLKHPTSPVEPPSVTFVFRAWNVLFYLFSYAGLWGYNAHWGLSHSQDHAPLDCDQTFGKGDQGVHTCHVHVFSSVFTI